MNSHTNPTPWEIAGQLFLENDGSLPEIDVHFSHDDELLKTVDALLSTSKGAATKEIQVWKIDGSGSQWMSVCDAARAVIAGEVESFHTQLTGVIHEGVTIPDLGLFIAPPEVLVDYRMGSEWNERNVAVFLRLLKINGGQVSASYWRGLIPDIDRVLSLLAGG